MKSIRIDGTTAPAWATSTSYVGQDDKTDSAIYMRQTAPFEHRGTVLQIEQEIQLNLDEVRITAPRVALYPGSEMHLTVDEARALARALVAHAAQLEKIEQDALRADA